MIRSGQVSCSPWNIFIKIITHSLIDLDKNYQIFLWKILLLLPTVVNLTTWGKNVLLLWPDILAPFEGNYKALWSYDDLCQLALTSALTDLTISQRSRVRIFGSYLKNQLQAVEKSIVLTCIPFFGCLSLMKGHWTAASVISFLNVFHILSALEHSDWTLCSPVNPLDNLAIFYVISYTLKRRRRIKCLILWH